MCNGFDRAKIDADTAALVELVELERELYRGDAPWWWSRKRKSERVHRYLALRRAIDCLEWRIQETKRESRRCTHA